MATGRTNWVAQLGKPDNPNQGDLDPTAIAGVSPEDPMVGGPRVPGLGQYDVDRGRSHVLNSLPGSADSASGHLAGAPGVEVIDDWRDLLNWRGSPMPWLLLLALAWLGFAQFRVSTRVGPASAKAALG